MSTVNTIHRTGFQRINQVLGDELFRQLPVGGSRKLVVFTDSRQDAAKLAAGMELDHYRDLVRQALVLGFNSLGGDLANALRYLDGERSAEVTEAMRRYRDLHNREWNALRDVHDGAASARDAALAARARSQASGPLQLTAIESSVWMRLLRLGVNPASPRPSCNGAAHGYRWTDLIDWSGSSPTMKSPADLGNRVGFLEQLRHALREECLFTLFAHNKKSVEALGFGWMTCDPSLDPGPALSLSHRQGRAVLDVAIRILGEGRRFSGSRRPYQYNSLPRVFLGYLRAAGVAGDPEAVRSDLARFMREQRIINDEHVLLPEQLWFQPVRESAWFCPRCATQHGHRGLGVCVFCLSPLPPDASPSQHGDPDYYAHLATSAEPFRLHCEELTGQTDRDDAPKRQRLFQGKTLGAENPLVDTVDLLSVTTKMEAGVDIGELQAVMLGNVPPRRSNYQQRVGRAGRRGRGLAVALTVARGRSHDELHFRDPRRIVASPTPTPYLDVRRDKIMRRVLVKEVLRRALASDPTLAPGTGGDSVHCEFGLSEEWPLRRALVDSWTEAAEGETLAIAQALGYGTPWFGRAHEAWAWIRENLISEVDARVGPDAEHALSQTLAHNGLLPMFGFPTRVRNLYHSTPRRLPSDEVVDRNLEIALSQFAPGSETVKDKAVHKAVGVVDYRFEAGRVVGKDGRGFVTHVGKCEACGALLSSPIVGADTCPVCGDRDYRTVEAWEPRDFTTEPGAAADFDGSFEWSPRAGTARLCSDTPGNATQLADGTNLAFAAMEGEVRTVNDAGGVLFAFEQLQRSRLWVVRSELNAMWRGQAAVPDSEVRVALLARRFAEMLLLRPQRCSPALDLEQLGGQGVYARAAYLSWGFLLRRSACASLDIDTDELEVNIRPVRDHEGAHWEVYLMDRLENGAGYASHLAQEPHLRRHLIAPLLAGGAVREALEAPDHTACDSSCYDCLRDYYNSDLHAVLDWRLGLDLAELAADAGYVPVLDGPLLSPIVAIAVRALLQILPDGEAAIVGGLPAVQARAGDVRVVLVHPLWSLAHPSVVAAAQALGSAPDALPLCTLFDALRRPGWAVGRLGALHA